MLGRMGLTMSPADPDIVYALVESKKTGLYKSTDGGENFDLVSTENIGNRPFYYAEIHADPQDPDRLFNLYSMVSESTDGGRTFDVILPPPQTKKHESTLYTSSLSFSYHRRSLLSKFQTLRIQIRRLILVKQHIHLDNSPASPKENWETSSSSSSIDDLNQ